MVSEKVIVERINPIENQGSALQISQTEIRYRIALNFVISGRSLDLGCGVGVGTRIIATHRPETLVFGVDVSKEAIETAAKHYNCSNTIYELVDIENLFLPYKIANVFFFEALEHLVDPEKAIENLINFLGAEARVFISVPIGEKPGDNKFHKQTFTREGFIALYKKYFKVHYYFEHPDDLMIIGAVK